MPSGSPICARGREARVELHEGGKLRTSMRAKKNIRAAFRGTRRPRHLEGEGEPPGLPRPRYYDCGPFSMIRKRLVKFEHKHPFCGFRKT